MHAQRLLKEIKSNSYKIFDLGLHLSNLNRHSLFWNAEFNFEMIDYFRHIFHISTLCIILKLQGRELGFLGRIWCSGKSCFIGMQGKNVTELYFVFLWISKHLYKPVYNGKYTSYSIILLCLDFFCRFNIVQLFF